MATPAAPARSPGPVNVSTLKPRLTQAQREELVSLIEAGPQAAGFTAWPFRWRRANVRAAVRKAIETHLRNEPAKASKSRIKRLRGLARPQYRLRVEEVRVFYDITGRTVEVLAVVAKSEAEAWLAQFGSPK